jgi:chorismate dehydratase
LCETGGLTRELKPRVCAVSYLNTTPLTWGLLHGPQRDAFDLRFEIPSICAALLRTGEVDIGLVPAIELERQPIEMIPPLGIVSRGAVRSILLVSRVPVEEITTLAADLSSRTSVVLAQVILAKRFGIRPAVTAMPPDVGVMLERADAALVIGDPALLIDPLRTDAAVTDLGMEWTKMTALPMVYAVWAARSGFDWTKAAAVLEASWRFGRERISAIVTSEALPRGVPAELACAYLTRNIAFEVDEPASRGLELFRSMARDGSWV